jgi:hypothetical protein
MRCGDAETRRCGEKEKFEAASLFFFAASPCLRVSLQKDDA